jgi:hypothetical protein
MNAVAATIMAARQSIAPSSSPRRTANHAPIAAVQRRSHRACRRLFGIVFDVQSLRRRDNAVWRINTTGTTGADANAPLEHGELDLRSLVMTNIPCRFSRTTVSIDGSREI